MLPDGLPGIRLKIDRINIRRLVDQPTIHPPVTGREGERPRESPSVTNFASGKMFNA